MLTDIADIKGHLPPQGPIPHTEIIPERMPPRIRVDPQKQIILFLPYLHHTVQVGRLEHRIKQEFGVLPDRRVHSLKSPIVYCCLVMFVVLEGFLQ
jgi:hypothetical protein